MHDSSRSANFVVNSMSWSARIDASQLGGVFFGPSQNMTRTSSNRPTIRREIESTMREGVLNVTEKVRHGNSAPSMKVPLRPTPANEIC
jgi:hypothetical protein